MGATGCLRKPHHVKPTHLGPKRGIGLLSVQPYGLLIAAGPLSLRLLGPLGVRSLEVEDKGLSFNVLVAVNTFPSEESKSIIKFQRGACEVTGTCQVLCDASFVPLLICK